MSLQLIEANSLLYGCQLKWRSRKWKYLNNVIVLFVLYRLLLVMIFEATNLNNVFIWLTYASNSIGTIGSIYVIRKKRLYILDMIKKVTEKLNQSRSKALNRCFKRLFAFHLISIGLSMFLHLYPIVRFGFYDGISHRLLRIFWWTSIHGLGYRIGYTLLGSYNALVSLQWIQFGHFIYVYVAITIELLFNQYIRQFQNLTTIDDHSIQTLLTTIENYRKLKQRFEDIFQLLPLMWFAYLFISLSGNIRYISESPPIDTVDFVTLVVLILKNILFTFYLTHLVNSYVKSNVKLCDDIRSRLYQYLPSMTMSHMSSYVVTNCLIDELKSMDIIYTACGMFKLDDSLFIGFLGGVVSFTVMFTQL